MGRVGAVICGVLVSWLPGELAESAPELAVPEKLPKMTFGLIEDRTGRRAVRRRDVVCVQPVPLLGPARFCDGVRHRLMGAGRQLTGTALCGWPEQHARKGLETARPKKGRAVTQKTLPLTDDQAGPSRLT